MKYNYWSLLGKLNTKYSQTNGMEAVHEAICIYYISLENAQRMINCHLEVVNEFTKFITREKTYLKEMYEGIEFRK